MIRRECQAKESKTHPSCTASDGTQRCGLQRTGRTCDWFLKLQCSDMGGRVDKKEMEEDHLSSRAPGFQRLCRSLTALHTS